MLFIQNPVFTKSLNFVIYFSHTHTHVHSLSLSLPSPCNVLRISGPFGLGEVHSWVSYCLPDIPDNPPAEDSATLYFRSTFIDSQLECSYRCLLDRSLVHVWFVSAHTLVYMYSRATSMRAGCRRMHTNLG